MAITESQRRSHKKYNEKRRMKCVSFNVETEKELYDFVQSIPNFSVWVKDRLTERMERKKQIDAACKRLKDK